MESMSTLGHKIFLTRYALKDPEIRLEIGDIVIACTNIEQNVREIGTIEAIDGDNITVFIEEKDETMTVSKANCIEKPLEYSYSDTVLRVSKAISMAEKTEKLQSKWKDAFNWLLSDFKFIP